MLQPHQKLILIATQEGILLGDFSSKDWLNLNTVNNGTKRIDGIVTNEVFYIHNFWYCSVCRFIMGTNLWKDTFMRMILLVNNLWRIAVGYKPKSKGCVCGMWCTWHVILWWHERGFTFKLDWIQLSLYVNKNRTRKSRINEIIKKRTRTRIRIRIRFRVRIRIRKID